KFDEENFTLEIIDAGAQDVLIEDGYINISCAMEDFGRVQKALDQMKLEAENAGLQRTPNVFMKLGDEELLKVMKLVDALEDDDDVQKVYHNIDITEEQMELL